MEYNLILAGVGGQGILSIAQAVSMVALRRGCHVKQSEVHGMSQRGGAVMSHLRVADHELFSDLIPLGRADMILSVEPLESMRYLPYLGPSGMVVCSSAPFVNIPNYPPVDELISRITQFNRHVLIDTERLARAAGSARASNIIMLGAAASFMNFEPKEFQDALSEMFARKGQPIVDVNLRAFEFGRQAAQAYVDGLRRGGSPGAVRSWIQSIPVEELSEAHRHKHELGTAETPMSDLSSAEANAISQILKTVQEEGRSRLYEHEVYRLVELAGAISPPRHRFVPAGDVVTREQLELFPSQKIVLKVVSPDLVHKSDAGGVVFVNNDADAVNREMNRLITEQRSASRSVHGVLMVEFVEQSHQGFGTELFVGVRWSREFGPIIAAGLGGVNTEYLASMMKPGRAVAKAIALDVSAESFFEEFKKTSAYDILAGKVRGHARIVSDGELLRCFRAFIGIAREFCVAGQADAGLGLAELEVNPFAFAHYRMIPIDGRAKIGQLIDKPEPRPIAKIESLLEPQSIAVMGVSAKRANFGRIILGNIKACGFPADRLYIIKDQAEPIDGVACVSSIEALPEKVDLLVVATAARDIPQLMDVVLTARKAESVILIPGGFGEKEGTEDMQSQVRAAIQKARRDGHDVPVFLGGNCLGVRSRAGTYDTFFIPDKKLDPRRDIPPRRAALISQSGAFIITRMSNLESLDPKLAISAGNQLDLTVSDLLRTVGRRDDIDCIGVYVEGFNDLDGEAFVRAVEEVTALGKTVVFYKAGRTSAGRTATMGHTASLAGDYDVCQAALGQAGAIVTDTFKEFEQLLMLATNLHQKRVGGVRVGTMSNAGYETVGMADTILGARYEVEMPALSDHSRERISQVLTEAGLSELVNPRNPLDVTPMADDAAYEKCAQAMLEADEMDALVVACVPLTPQLFTTEDEVADPASLASRLPRVFAETDKPLIAVIDSGVAYNAMDRQLRDAGIPVFRTSDQAIRSLGRYLCYRMDRQTREQAAQAKAVAAAKKAEGADAETTQPVG